jgi:hypothetical protein
MRSLKTVHTDGKENSASGPKTKEKERAPNLWRILQSGGRRTQKLESQFLIGPNRAFSTKNLRYYLLARFDAGRPIFLQSFVLLPPAK